MPSHSAKGKEPTHLGSFPFPSTHEFAPLMLIFREDRGHPADTVKE